MRRRKLLRLLRQRSKTTLVLAVALVFAGCVGMFYTVFGIGLVSLDPGSPRQKLKDALEIFYLFLPCYFYLVVVWLSWSRARAAVIGLVAHVPWLPFVWRYSHDEQWRQTDLASPMMVAMLLYFFYVVSLPAAGAAKKSCDTD